MEKKRKNDRMSWFKHDPAKFNQDTYGLSSQAVGIYIKLMNLYWINQQKLPEQKSVWLRQLGVNSPSEIEDLNTLISELGLANDGDGFLIPDLDQQLEDIRGYSTQQSLRASSRYKETKEAVATDNPHDF